MRITNLGGYRSVDAFVKAKLRRLDSSEPSFRSLFEIMFSERENIMFEKSVGYRIKKKTYGECREGAEQRAARLCALLGGAEKGATVGLYMENGSQWIECFWAILLAGFNVLLMNLRLDGNTLNGILSDTGAVAVISDSLSFSVPTFSADRLLTGGSVRLPDDLGREILMISSGTSSSVKICSYTADELIPVIKNSADIVSSSRRIKAHYDGQLKLLTFLPFYHIFGFVAVYLWFSFFSRTFVELNDMSPNTVVNTIRRHNVTHIFAVPLFWNKVYESALATVRSRGEETEKRLERGLSVSKKLEICPPLYRLFARLAFKEIRDNMFGDSVKFMITGGSEIKTEVISFFNSIGYHLSNGYGMTETGITSVELSDNPRLLNSCSVGLPLSCFEYTLSGDKELLVRSSACARYIIKNGERLDRGEWFRTNDIAQFKNGRYYILGRKDDLIVDGSGENLNPSMTEALMGKIPNVKEFCLVGVDSPVGKKPVLIVGTEKYIDNAAALMIKSDISARLSELKLNGRIADIFITQDDLIDGSEIKLNRRIIAERLQKGQLKEFGSEKGPSGFDGDGMTMRLAAIFSDILGKPVSSMDADYDFFTDGGGTSLDYFTLTAAVTETFSVALPTASDRTLSRICEIAEYIKSSKIADRR